MARILCVEENPNTLQSMRSALEAAGHSTVACTSIQAGIDRLQRENWDAVIAAWRIGGQDASPILAAAKSRGNLPVAVLSRFVTEAFQAAEPLADLYLEKPVEPAELAAAVEELLKAGVEEPAT